MFDHLAVNVDFTAGSHQSCRLYVPGSTLLTWVQAAAQAVFASSATLRGRGTQRDPYLLGGYSSYVGAWQAVSTARKLELYFSIAGRTIRKLAAGDRRGGFADGFYMSDLGFSGSDLTDGTIWHRWSGASYREFGKFIHEGNTLSGMEGVVWSQRLASQLRMVLKGKTGAHAGKGSPKREMQAHGSRWSVDMNPHESVRKAPQKLSGPARATKTDT